jgi:hypothetical protein
VWLQAMGSECADCDGQAAQNKCEDKGIFHGNACM